MVTGSNPHACGTSQSTYTHVCCHALEAAFPSSGNTQLGTGMVRLSIDRDISTDKCLFTEALLLLLLAIGSEVTALLRAATSPGAITHGPW